MTDETGKNLYLRLRGTDQNNTSAIPITDLSKSLYGFGRIIEDFAHICRLNAEIEVTANPPEEGSFVVGVTVHVKIAVGQLPFEHVSHLLDFLRLYSDEALKEAHIFFKQIDHAHDYLNQYFAKNAFDTALFAYLIPKLIDRAKKLKTTLSPPDENTSKRVAKEINGMIKRNGFKRLLWPIINETVDSVEVSTDRHFTKEVSRIDNKNFDQLLGKDNEILPDLINGDTYTMLGVITSLKSTRGDSLTFHYTTHEGVFNLELFPPIGIDTKHYKLFYKENVVLVAKIDRSSLYKKPKLRMVNMSTVQPMLLSGDADYKPADLTFIDQIDFKNTSGLLPHIITPEMKQKNAEESD